MGKKAEQQRKRKRKQTKARRKPEARHTEWPTKLSDAELASEKTKIAGLLEDASRLFEEAHAVLKKDPTKGESVTELLKNAFAHCNSIDLKCRETEKRSPHSKEMFIWCEAATTAHHYFCTYFKILFTDAYNGKKLEDWSPTDWASAIREHGVRFGIEAYLLGPHGPFNYANYASSRGACMHACTPTQRPRLCLVIVSIIVSSPLLMHAPFTMLIRTAHATGEYIATFEKDLPVLCLFMKIHCKSQSICVCAARQLNEGRPRIYQHVARAPNRHVLLFQANCSLLFPAEICAFTTCGPRCTFLLNRSTALGSVAGFEVDQCTKGRERLCISNTSEARGLAIQWILLQSVGRCNLDVCC